MKKRQSKGVKRYRLKYSVEKYRKRRRIKIKYTGRKRANL